MLFFLLVFELPDSQTIFPDAEIPLQQTLANFLAASSWALVMTEA